MATPNYALADKAHAKLELAALEVRLTGQGFITITNLISKVALRLTNSQARVLAEQLTPILDVA